MAPADAHGARGWVLVQYASTSGWLWHDTMCILDVDGHRVVRLGRRPGAGDHEWPPRRNQRSKKRSALKKTLYPGRKEKDHRGNGEMEMDTEIQIAIEVEQNSQRSVEETQS